jgi:hypothetical protein
MTQKNTPTASDLRLTLTRLVLLAIGAALLAVLLSCGCGRTAKEKYPFDILLDPVTERPPTNAVPW